MTTGPFSTAAPSCSADQVSHDGSSVSTSRRTFESTSVPREASATARHRHDLVGAQVDVSLAEQGIDDAASSPGHAVRRHDPRETVLDHDVDLVPRLETESVPHVLGDRDLPLAGDPHPVRVQPVLPTIHYLDVLYPVSYTHLTLPTIYSV